MKQNLIIRASAGTGKTFSLATRFIRLMVLQKVRPERIVALTFSRAAAQEIYTKLLDRLWSAAVSDAGAQKEKALLLQGMSDSERALIEAGNSDWSAHRFACILRDVIGTQYHGAIATLDSFILKVVRSFPLEMGFQNAVEVLDGFGEKRAVESSRDILLAGEDKNGDFTHAFKTLTHGRFVRTCVTVLERGLYGWRDFLLNHPECREWTPESMRQALGISFDFAISELDILPAENKRGNPFMAIKNVGASFNGDGDIYPRNKGGDLMRYLFDHPNEETYLYVTESGKEKKIECTPEQADVIRRFVRHLLNVKLARALDVVHAKLAICKLIEREYNSGTRSRGQLTFADFTNCQALAEEDSERALNLENLQFRFDSRFDHWALDEFQDTSELQWLCLRRLVQEAAQPNPDRSVMAVGDLKQSIYTWRGGNDAPFKEMMDGWREFRGDIGEIVPNDVSYRYEKNTADFINMVFGARNVRDSGVLGIECEPAVDRWLAADCWMEHRPDTDKNGIPKSGDYVEIVKVAPEEDGDEEGAVESDENAGSAPMRVLSSGICTLVADLWAQHEATKSTDTIGILVRNNRDGAALAERLRSTCIPGSNKALPVVWEGSNGVLDAPVVRAVLELLKLSEHPQDTFARQMVETLFPVRELVFPDLETAEGISKAVSKMLTQIGLARTLKEMTRRIVTSELKPDARSVLRLEALVREAVNYERRRDASHGILHFIDYLGTTAGREASSSADVIRILTIHRSKGLTLDHVIVPILETAKSDSIVKPRVGTPLFLKNEPWAIDGVSELYAKMHPHVYKAWLWAANERVLEQLRLYYVALTRARKSTHIFVCDDVRSVNKVQFRDVLLKPFEGSDAACVKSYGTVVAELGTMPAFARKDKLECNVEAIAWKHAIGRIQMKRSSPAAENVVVGTDKGFSLGALFAHRGTSAKDRGLLAHEQYSQIEWIDPASPKNSEEQRILDSAWAEAFIKPSAAISLWRERAYEIFIDGVWETGRFDRVVFTSESGERYAVIYDFKTHFKRADESDEAFADRVRDAARNQMKDYRRSLAVITGIPMANIQTKLLLNANHGMATV